MRGEDDLRRAAQAKSAQLAESARATSRSGRFKRWKQRYCAGPFQKSGSCLTHSAGGLLMRGLIWNRFVAVVSILAAVSSSAFAMPLDPSSLENFSESATPLSVSLSDFIVLTTTKVPPVGTPGTTLPYMTSKQSQCVSGATLRKVSAYI